MGIVVHTLFTINGEVCTKFLMLLNSILRLPRHLQVSTCITLQYAVPHNDLLGGASST